MSIACIDSKAPRAALHDLRTQPHAFVRFVGSWYHLANGHGQREFDRSLAAQSITYAHCTVSVLSRGCTPPTTRTQLHGLRTVQGWYFSPMNLSDNIARRAVAGLFRGKRQILVTDGNA